MTEQQADKAIEMLRGIQADLSDLKRSLREHSARLGALDELFRDTKVLMDTEH